LFNQTFKAYMQLNLSAKPPAPQKSAITTMSDE